MSYRNVLKSSVTAMICAGLFCVVNAYAENSSTTNSSTINNNGSSSMSSSLSSEMKSKAEGEAFLAANKKKPGVVTLPDGLQYKIITQGTGPQPSDADTVTVDYSGKLIDGTEFDSSYKRGQPATFPVQGVIPGWVEALKLMKVGSTWELYIPSSLAYGEQGAPPVIGPNQTLIFRVTLISIQK